MASYEDRLRKALEDEEPPTFETGGVLQIRVHASGER